MKDKLFITIVCVFLTVFFLASPVIAVLGLTGHLDVLNTKNLIINEKIYEDDIPAAGLLNAVEEGKTFLKNVYVNCIPFYSSVVSTVQSAEMTVLRLTDSLMQPLIAPNITVVTPVIPAETGGETEKVTEAETEKVIPEINYYSLLVGGGGRPYIYAIEPLKALERVEGASEKEFQKLTERQLNHIHRLKNATPEINYYVYMGTRIQETEMFDNMITGPLSTKPYFDYFTENLDSGIKFDYFRLETPEDRINKKYRADHHWNMAGAYEGYKQIINMMVEDSPVIGKPREYEILQVPGIKWLGSLGGAVGQNDPGYADDFYILDLSDLPKYGGNTYRIKDMQESFMNGDYSGNGLNFDYYGTYNQPQKRYVFKENDTGRNLLLLGDSYSWSITTIIASHFDTTICHNTPWTVGNDVRYDYRELISQYNITDVLILLYSSRLLFGYDATDFARMKTE